MLLGKVFNDILTELDGETYDVTKLLWVAGVMVYLILSIISVFKGQSWDPQQYGIGLGVVLAGGGAAIKLRNMADDNSALNKENAALQKNIQAEKS
jgi:hypothetical protein